MSKSRTSTPFDIATAVLSDWIMRRFHPDVRGNDFTKLYDERAVGEAMLVLLRFRNTLREHDALINGDDHWNWSDDAPEDDPWARLLASVVTRAMESVTQQRA